MRRFVQLLCAAAVLAGPSALAQNAAPEIAFESAPRPLALPDDIYLGEVGGVATNSRGEIFVYTRTGHPTISIGTARAFAHGGSRLFQFDRAGKFMREIGQGSYGFMFAQKVRVDREDNLWVVDEMSNSVTKFDSAGRVQMILGRKPEAVSLAAPAPRGQGAGAGGGRGGGGAEGAGGGGGRGGGGVPQGAGAQSDVFNRPTDVAWDAAGNIFVADGNGNNARVAKFNSKGVFVKSWGSRGDAPGLFGSVLSIAVDAQGNVYVADGGNKRIQVFDNNGTFKTEYANIGTPAALCITPGPAQVLYSSNSNPPDDFDVAGEIYKMTLDGTILGKFGKAGKLLKEFGTVNAIDCRTENNLLVGEVANMRVQRITLR